MSYADQVFIQNCKDILSKGVWDTDRPVRPKWEDGTPAHTIKLFGVVNRYDLKKEFPIITVRRQYLKSAVDELLWIWQKKSNNIHDLNGHIWDEWADADGSIGKAYGYQLGVKHQYKEGWFDFGTFTCPLWIARYPSTSQTAWADSPPEQYKPSVGRTIWGWQWTSNGRLPGIDGPVDFDICYQDPAEWAAPEKEPGVIYTVSVADVWTRAQAEEVQRQLAAIGIQGVVHKVRILE